MDQVHQPLERTLKCAPDAATEGDAWSTVQKKGLKFRLVTVPVCPLDNLQICPSLTNGQKVLWKTTFQSLFFEWLAYNLMPFKKLFIVKAAMSVYSFLIKMLSKTAGFMYISIFLLTMIS